MALLSVSCAENSINSSSLTEIEGKLTMKRGSYSRDPVLILDNITTGQDFMIQNPDSFNLINRQNQTVKVKARLVQKEMGPGRFAIIEVIEVKN